MLDSDGNASTDDNAQASRKQFKDGLLELARNSTVSGLDLVGLLLAMAAMCAARMGLTDEDWLASCEASFSQSRDRWRLRDEKKANSLHPR